MILERLKNETQVNHEKMESSFLLRKIGDKSITLPDYMNILQKFYGFFHPLENSLNGVHEVKDFLPDFSERRKSSSLAKDIQVLGGVVTSCALCADLPKATNVKEAFGILYVMEGSTLGGRMISKILQEKLLLTVDGGITFFNGYGPLTGEKWNMFRQALVNVTEKSNDPETVISSANQTFDKFYKWINQ